MEHIQESARSIEVAGKYDVVVVGGGPAGFTAAVSAARMGASTLLVEQSGMIGGIATAGLMSHWGGWASSSILNELLDKAAKPGPEEECSDKKCINPEKLKFLMLEMLYEERVTVLLYSFCADVIKEGDRVRGVIVESKSGRRAMLGSVVIDASGDGDAAWKAGAAFQKGRNGDGKMQPVTVMCKVGGVDLGSAVFPGSFETNLEVPKGKVQDLARKHLPLPAGHTLLYPSTLPGVVTVNMTNFIGIDGTRAEDLTRGEYECRKQIDKIVAFIREFIPGYEHCFLISTSSLIGVRETRHFIGEYVFNEDDILASKVFDDWIVANATFNFDIHNIEGPGLDKHGAQHEFPKITGYTIPYRALVPEKIDGLLLAGRNISGTHKAHSNYRVMPICAAMGEGAGIAAALAAKKGVAPRRVDVKEVQDVLRSRGVHP
ncbi:MAG: FAD-dependent oxidoreductase [Candidatus Lindowbacteria bacterium]|nr:FAD-dependent oxidoreductase [Candidatus Lindowbacteria bacterium]